VADVDGATLVVDEEDLVGPIEGEHPRAQSAAFDEGPYHERAAAARRTKSTSTKTVTKPRAIRETFDSAAAAAAEFYQRNELFFDSIGDARDGLVDWMDGIEVGARGRAKRLSATPAGERILAQRGAQAQITAAIAYVLGQAKGRRWDAVDLRELDRLGLALEPYAEGEGAAGIYWRPSVGGASVEDLEGLSVDERERLTAWESAEEVRTALEDLRDAYARNLDCPLSPQQRSIIERRIAEWNRWARDPSKIPEYACEPDASTGGYTCNYPSVAGELRELGRACERGYDPDWAEPAGRAAEAGFPDLSAGPDDPMLDAAESESVSAAAAPEPEIEPLRQLAEGGRAFGGPAPAIVDSVEVAGVLYRLEHVKCGSRWCWCRGAYPSGGHGPYWYAYWVEDNGRRRSAYIGKKYREL
jgi:hypothetical protein